MWGIQFCDAAELEPQLQKVSLASNSPTKSSEVGSLDSKEYLLVDYPNFENRGEKNLRCVVCSIFLFPNFIDFLFSFRF